MLRNFLSFLKGSRNRAPADEVTHYDIFLSPELLYRYIKTNLLNEGFFAENTSHIQKLRTKFVIPSHCAEQYIKEREMIMTAGILFYINRAFPKNFYTVLRGYFLDSMFNTRVSTNKMCEREEIDQVLYFYEFVEEPSACEEFFLSRVFSGTPLHDELKGSELLQNITFNYRTSMSEIIREDHMRAMNANVQRLKHD